MIFCYLNDGSRLLSPIEKWNSDALKLLCKVWGGPSDDTGASTHVGAWAGIFFFFDFLEDYGRSRHCPYIFFFFFFSFFFLAFILCVCLHIYHLRSVSSVKPIPI